MIISLVQHIGCDTFDSIFNECLDAYKFGDSIKNKLYSLIDMNTLEKYALDIAHGRIEWWATSNIVEEITATGFEDELKYQFGDFADDIEDKFFNAVSTFCQACGDIRHMTLNPMIF